jgi:hypothetical protein
MERVTAAVRQLPGLGSERRGVRIAALLYYIFVLFLVLGSFLGGVTDLIGGMFFVAAFLLPVIVYARRDSLPLVGSEGTGQRLVGWLLVFFAFLGCMSVGGAVVPEAEDTAHTAKPLLEVPTEGALEEPQGLTVVTAEPTRAQTTTATRTPNPRPTMRPSATDAPASETPVPATQTPLPPTPTEIPSTAVPPTAPPPVNLDPRQDRKCDEFDSYDQMVAWRNYWIARGIPNPGHLDGDGDGVACEEGEGGRPAPPPPPQPAVQQPPPPAAQPPPPRACCKYCTPGKSKPCGDTCIRLSYTCRSGPGCACAGP